MGAKRKSTEVVEDWVPNFLRTKVDRNFYGRLNFTSTKEATKRTHARHESQIYNQMDIESYIKELTS